MDDDEVITVTGTVISDYSKTLIPGWNLIGPVEDILIPDTLEISGQVWGFEDGGYFEADLLERFYGYWAYSMVEAQIQL